jgi:hypothetical protein
MLTSQNESSGLMDTQTSSNETLDLDFNARFVAYSVLAACGFAFNVISFAALCHTRSHKSVHQVLLRNLAVCDMLGSVLLWMYYNSPCIFPKFPVTQLQHCMFIALVLVAPFLLSLCASCTALLMLAFNQYMAICHPLFATTRISRGTALLGVCVNWVLTVVIATIPALLMLALSSFEDCAQYASKIGVRAVEVCTYALTCLILLIVALYARIYREVLQYRKRLPQLQMRCLRDPNAPGRRSETEHNFKAFVTTFLLSGTLVVFWIPFMVVHFISMHLHYDQIPVVVFYLKFYVVDFLPMLNFMTDPLIYGMRMREVRSGYKRLFARMCPRCVSLPQEDLTRNSVRFTTLDTTSF